MPVFCLYGHFPEYCVPQNFLDTILSTEHTRQCRVVAGRACSTELVAACSTAVEEECSTALQRECVTVQQQQCRTETQQMCSTQTQQLCDTVNDQMCSAAEVKIIELLTKFCERYSASRQEFCQLNCDCRITLK